MNTQAGEMGQRREAGKQRSQRGVVQYQWVAAAQDHFADGCVGGEARQRDVQRATANALGIGKFTSEAVTAVDGAGPGHYQQGATAVLADESAVGEVAGFVQGIGTVADAIERLGRERQDLTQQRIGRIAGPHTRREGPRHMERECAVGRELDGFRIDAEVAQ